MTSFAFILGLLPLVIAVGPGAASRRAVGTPVFYGMLASTAIGLFIIPMLYLVFQWMREKTGWKPAQATPTEPAASQSPGERPEERRVGKEWVRTCSSWWPPYKSNKNKHN